MPDETQTIPEVPAATSTAPSEQTTAPSVSQTPPQNPDHGGITDVDFQHPEFGVKFKNAHSGMQKAQQEAADIRREKQALESNLAGIRAMIQEDPAVASAMVRHLEAKGQTVPAQLKALAAKAAAKQDEDDDDTRPLTKADEKRLRAEMQAAFGTRDTVLDFQHQAGGGDLGKGSAIYAKDGLGIMKVMEEFDFPATTKHMMLAHKIFTERQAASRPAQSETPSAPATSDMGRSNGAAPASAPVDGVPTLQQWLAAAGFSSEAEFHRAQRGS